MASPESKWKRYQRKRWRINNTSRSSPSHLEERPDGWEWNDGLCTLEFQSPPGIASFYEGRSVLSDLPRVPLIHPAPSNLITTYFQPNQLVPSPQRKDISKKRWRINNTSHSSPSHLEERLDGWEWNDGLCTLEQRVSMEGGGECLIGFAPRSVNPSSTLDGINVLW
ncbi:hypothetical protein CDAR_183261 [Caerostris darwini]|uniref:Uncharacterized protein n=1 Tax=Caerostris darwini TaxID=1538125 RepID=A0AAV4TAI5_9ARAC|nr:hypothetical protein CDAR_183261 [Caerostris darwini]